MLEIYCSPGIILRGGEICENMISVITVILQSLNHLMRVV